MQTEKLLGGFDLDEFREQWKDVTPVPSHQDEKLPFYVHHSEKYETYMGIFRHVLNVHEISQRALELTKIVICRMPCDNTAWNYRRQLLDALGFEWEEEAKFLNDLMSYEIKPYQLWKHRRWLDDKSETAPDEKKFLFELIVKDQKNFHAWNFFLWFVRRWGVYDYFLQFTTDILFVDSQNNSAWSARLEIIKIMKLPTQEYLEHALGCIKKNHTNEACAIFIRGLVQYDNSLLDLAIEKVQEIAGDSEEKILLILQYFLAVEKKDFAKVETLCEQLSKVDEMRNGFWMNMKNNKYSKE